MLKVETIVQRDYCVIFPYYEEQEVGPHFVINLETIMSTFYHILHKASISSFLKSNFFRRHRLRKFLLL